MNNRLRILAYNIRHGAGMDRRIDLERLARVISACKPDIALLQEIDQGVDRSGRVDQMAVLGRLAGLHHAFGSFFKYGGGLYGLGALARWPLEEPAAYRWSPELGSRFYLVVRPAVAAWPGDLLFTSIHLYTDPAERRAQTDRLIRLFAQEQQPVLLAGDFNAFRDSEELALLQQHWTAAPKQEPAFTFPADAPDREIDFVLYRPADRFVLVESRVIDEPLASDHRPVLAEFEI